MAEIEEFWSLILVSFSWRHGGSNSHRPNCCSTVLAAAGQRTQGYSGLEFLSAMTLTPALCFVEKEQTQCLELLFEKKCVQESYWPMTASTTCNEPKQSWRLLRWVE